ncbi:MAG: murein biosynthesis integral membrane protein MurJ [Parasphingorhabdus sp.]|uniref:murein biosynthesis integral membrane protein MurJ n=1 Tax=Parasphingorhabdus sp. TaxID=2709688 RepID=UPI00329A1FA6
MNLLKSTGTIAGLTMVSRIFGFMRDIILARVLGAGAAADAWQLAFQLPNIFRRLFAEGAFSAAFVPLFNRKMEEDEQRSAAQNFAIDVLSVFVPILLFFSAIFMLAMPAIIWFIDDFGEGGRTTDFTISLARITFPYLGLISVTTLFAAILNSVSRFAAAAAAPIMLNICMISALLITMVITSGGAVPTTENYGFMLGVKLESVPHLAAYLLAFSVALAGFLQMVWLYYWARKAGFSFAIHRPRITPDIKELGILILPAIFGAGIYQISRFIDLFFLGRLPEGSFVYLAMADRLNQLPLGIIGIALGTAILPALSRFIAKNDQGGAQRLQSNAIELAMLLTIPAAIALFFAAGPLVTSFYVGGNFAASDGATTANVVAALVVGLPAYVLVKVLIPGFFARKDTRTPVYTAAISLGVNIALNLLLIPLYGIVGLAFAGAVAAWTNCLMLYAMLHRRGHFHLKLALLWRIGRITLSAAGMAVVLIYAAPIGDTLYGGTVWQRIGSITALVSVGGLVYAVLAWVTGAVDRDKITMLTKKKAAEQAGQEG